MAPSNHYHTLEVQPTATQAEIKHAYRRLAKLFHPDSQRTTASHDKISSLNLAYEILSDPKQRQFYDRQMGITVSDHHPSSKASSTAGRSRSSGRAVDEDIQRWLKRVYQPVNRRLCQILYPLSEQIDDLAADPFDDDLMDSFLRYLENCREWLRDAQQMFQSMPNPSNVAGAAAHLYYCLSHVGDGLDELERFTYNYSEHDLHTGVELLRIANGLRREAQATIRELG